MVGTRRNKFEIVYKLLSHIVKKGGTVQITNLMYKVNTSNKMLKKYLHLLQERNLIKIHEYKVKIRIFKTIIITEKGLELHKKLLEILSSQEKIQEEYPGLLDNGKDN